MANEKATIDPDDAFRLLSDETRMAILHALWAASNPPLSFTDIRDHIGQPDSGQFNYHLNKLRDHYVTETDDGYVLTQAGREVVRAVHAGILTDQPATEPVSIEANCADCGGDLVARFDEHGYVECSYCGATVMWNEFPPAGLEDRTNSELASAFDRWTQRRFRLAMDGVCPSCAASMETTRVGQSSTDGTSPTCLYRCSNCRYEARVPLFGHILDHPGVIGFFYDHGFDITNQPYWRLQSLARAHIETDVMDDPWRAIITIEVGGDTLVVRLDEALDVVDLEMSPD